MAGYSGTPLVAKLGIKRGSRVIFRHEPRNFRGLLIGLPEDLVYASRGELDFAVLFVKDFATLRRDFAAIMKRLAPAGMLWVSWPKKSSGLAADLDENTIRDHGLAEGLVDVKVCAIDDTWSGLKFVRRLKDR
ncbi:MAG: DUF3052 domain-containing protein [Gemmatimonadota bacterium]|nr:DUF3052 domain-containing protein [Gemmatimonadota bacterium]